MTKAERRLIVADEQHAVETAVRADGRTSPASEFLDSLKAGFWAEDPSFQDEYSDEQVDDYHKLIHKMKFLAAYGEPERGTDVNYLESGVWEFKAADKRVAFYDTDGRGAWTPKPKIRDIKNADDPDPNGFWWFPTMDEYIRLLNAWPKIGKCADMNDIEEAISIAEEDRHHDKDHPECVGTR